MRNHMQRHMSERTNVAEVHDGVGDKAILRGEFKAGDHIQANVGEPDAKEKGLVLQ